MANKKCCNQKFSGIGGQAVLEGIMMRNGKKYAVAVRKPDGDIAVDVKEDHNITQRHKWMRWPVIRGVFSFIVSLKIGYSTLMYSSKFYEEALPEEERETDPKKQERTEKTIMVFSLVLSLVLAIGLFSFLPVLIASPIKLLTDSHFVLALAEGLLRVAIFILYVWAISFMKDIKRTYQYHGAEHKCINCVETGHELTVENVRQSSKEHKRCGTSFLLIVMVMSVFIFMFIHVDNIFLRLLSRLLMIPVIAGLSFEFLQLAGRSNSTIMRILSRPGMWLQGLTTKEPDDSMIEVAIAATEAVFDWREFLGLPPAPKEELANETAEKITEDAAEEAAEKSEDENIEPGIEKTVSEDEIAGEPAGEDTAAEAGTDEAIASHEENSVDDQNNSTTES